MMYNEIMWLILHKTLKILKKEGKCPMKKSFIAWLTVIVMLMSTIGMPVFAEVTTDTVVAQTEVIAKADYGKAGNIGAQVLQNEKYVFVVEGETNSGFQNTDIRINDKIHIYEKPNKDHFDYKHLTAISVAGGSGSRNAPAKSVALFDDVLYVVWGNIVYSKTAGTHATNPADGDSSYAIAYDVSDVEEGEVPPKKIFQTSVMKRLQDRAPFIRGGILAVDEEKSKAYVGGVIDANYGRGEYYEFSTNDVKAYLTGEASSISRKIVLTSTKSMNAVEFAVKDGYLFEILHQRAGFIDLEGAPTLKDADGNAINNTITIWDADAFSKIGAATTADAAKMTDYAKGEYVTETSGGIAMKDVEIKDDYMYVATTAGIEVVDISAVKEAEEVVTLSKDASSLAIGKVNGLYIYGDTLYAGTDNEMLMYDISEGIPSLTYTLPYTGGFVDFSYSEEENMLYMLSAAAKGGVVILDLDTLEEGITVSDFSFIQNGAQASSVKEGDLSFEAEIENKGQATVELNTILALYKGNKLVDIDIDEYSLSNGDKISAGGTVAVKEGKGYSVKFMIADSFGKLIPINTGKNMVYEKEIGELASAETVSTEGFEVCEPDEFGNFAVSGTVPDLEGKSVLIMAENLSVDNNTDRLGGIRFADVVTVGEKGAYSALITPSDAGQYSITASKSVNKGMASNVIELPSLSVSASETIEIPEINSFVYVEVENAQNVEKLNVKLSFDAGITPTEEELSASEEFVIKDVKISGNSIETELVKNDAVTLKTDKYEILEVPVDVASDAAIKDYKISVSAAAYDELGYELSAQTVNGKINVTETTEKYNVLSDTKEALKAIKNADEIVTDDYLSEKDKIETAKAKIKEAYTYLLRDSQIGNDLLENLYAAEKKMEELLPYYEAVGNLNGAEASKVVETLKKESDKFGISEDALDIYDELEDKTEIDALLFNTTFEKPSDVMKAFYGAVVLEAMPDASWQAVELLLQMAETAEKLDLDEYNELTDEQKAEAKKALALTEYEDFDALEDALGTAVSDAKEEVKKKPSNSGGGNGGGGNREYFVQPEPEKEPQKEPVKQEIFNDISEFGWAKTAIETLYNKGIINGKASKIFAPSDNVTREEFAKMVSIAFNINSSAEKADFKDVNEGAWYAEYIYALSENGIIMGREDGSFGVGDLISREDMAVILERIAAKKEISLSETEVSFADSDDISGYAKSSIAKMCASGIISGYPDGSVKPRDFANRAQAAQLIYNLMILL